MAAWVRLIVACLVFVLSSTRADDLHPMQVTSLVKDRQIDFSEKADHGVYLSCITRFGVSFMDECTAQGKLLAAKRVYVYTSIQYSYNDGLRATADVYGEQQCIGKPERFKLQAWKIIPLQANHIPAWSIDQNNRAITDSVEVAAIRDAETSGMKLQAAREDGRSYASTLIAVPTLIRDEALWKAAQASHAYCVEALAATR